MPNKNRYIKVITESLKSIQNDINDYIYKCICPKTTLPLHTSKMLDGLHKLLPLLLHTKKKQNDKKKRIRLFIRFFSPFFQKNVLFSLTRKSCFFFFEKIGKPKKSRFFRFLSINRRFLLLGFICNRDKDVYQM
jgi:hypothetical protein